jgi:hypothetical protein
MEEEENKFEWFKINWAPVPKEFWSDLTNKPFENCILCETYLLDGEVDYMIEKAIKKYKGTDTTSTLFEHAMCFGCIDKFKGKLSESSTSKIKEYQESRIRLEERRKDLEGSLDVKDWIGKCVLHHTESAEDGEYQIYGHCAGDHMIFNDFPFMIKGEAIDDMVDLMSDETLDELRRFSNDITAGPPEFRELLDKGPRVLV